MVCSASSVNSVSGQVGDEGPDVEKSRIVGMVLDGEVFQPRGIGRLRELSRLLEAFD